MPSQCGDFETFLGFIFSVLFINKKFIYKNTPALTNTLIHWVASARMYVNLLVYARMQSSLVRYIQLSARTYASVLK